MTQPSQASVLAALQTSSSSIRSRPPPSTSLCADHADPRSALTTGGPSRPANARKIYCFRETCGSLILAAEVAEWDEAEGNIIPTDPSSPFPTSTPLPDSQKHLHAYWRVPGSPLAFENIGFSKASDMALPPGAPGTKEAKGKVKWLICAECDSGPIGWSFEGGQDAWLAVDRVRYGDVTER